MWDGFFFFFKQTIWGDLYCNEWLLILHPHRTSFWKHSGVLVCENCVCGSNSCNSEKECIAHSVSTWWIHLCMKNYLQCRFFVSGVCVFEVKCSIDFLKCAICERCYQQCHLQDGDILKLRPDVLLVCCICSLLFSSFPYPPHPHALPKCPGLCFT